MVAGRRITSVALRFAESAQVERVKGPEDPEEPETDGAPEAETDGAREADGIA